MEYQKFIKLLDNTSNQPSKFKSKNWTEINDQARGVYTTNSDIRFSGNGAGDNAGVRQGHERIKGVIFKDCASFINYKSEINSIEIDNAKDNV